MMCLRGVRKFKFNIFNWFFRKKITMMPVGKIKNSLNCHNSGFIKGSHNFWFYGIVFESANLTASLKFTPKMIPVTIAWKFETKSSVSKTSVMLTTVYVIDDVVIDTVSCHCPTCTYLFTDRQWMQWTACAEYRTVCAVYRAVCMLCTGLSVCWVQDCLCAVYWAVWSVCCVLSTGLSVCCVQGCLFLCCVQGCLCCVLCTRDVPG